MQINLEKETTRNIENLVSKRLKQRRLMLGLSLKETGEVIGISPSQVKKSEEADFSPFNFKFYQIRKFLNVLKVAFFRT